MSQQQPEKKRQESVTYGDLFSVQDDLAMEPIKPKDAGIMQIAETAMMGYKQKGGAAAMMQSAAMENEKAGFVDVNEGPAERAVTITETEMPGKRILAEAISGQIVRQYSQKVPLKSMMSMTTEATFRNEGGITIGEALEATALTAGEKPVEWSDAAAIQAAEVRATGRTSIAPGGVAAVAQSAANLNARITKDEDKTKLADILQDATKKLPADRPATRKDAEGVTGAEMRNDPFLTTHPAGVAAFVAAAARINQQKSGK